MSEEQLYTIVPIKGMEYVQKNFVKYADGVKSAEEFIGNNKPTLAKRFQLIERGYYLKLRDENTKSNYNVKTFLQCKSINFDKENLDSKQTTKDQTNKSKNISKPLSTTKKPNDENALKKSNNKNFN